MSDDATTRQNPRDERAVSEFVERFAGILVEGGWPRMASRVFCTLLASEEGRLTAAELAERLQVSPAAISGAVRYLVQLDMIGRQRGPGTRRDCFVVEDDFWPRVIEHQVVAMTKWGERLKEGIASVGEGSAAAERLAETAALFDFVRVETPAMLRRWRELRDSN